MHQSCENLRIFFYLLKKKLQMRLYMYVQQRLTFTLQNSLLIKADICHLHSRFEIHLAEIQLLYRATSVIHSLLFINVLFVLFKSYSKSRGVTRITLLQLVHNINKTLLNGCMTLSTCGSCKKMKCKCIMDIKTIALHFLTAVQVE